MAIAGKNSPNTVGINMASWSRAKDKFYGYADSGMVRGIVAIMLAMVDGKTVEEIKKFDLSGEFAKLHLNFGASRLNGIQSMINFFQNL